MKIRLNFKAWDTQLSKKYAKKRLWIFNKIWTPIIRIDLRQHEMIFK